MNRTQYFHSCGYNGLGTCEDCTSLYPGNWWSQLDEEEEEETCCTPTRYIRAKKILFQVNETSACPTTAFLSQASDMLPVLLTCAGIIGAGVAAYYIYRCITKTREVNNNDHRRATAGTTAAVYRGDDEDGIEWIEMTEFNAEGATRQAESTTAVEKEDDDVEYGERETASVKSEAKTGPSTEVNVDMYAGLAKMWDAEKDDDDDHIYEEIFFMED